MSEIEAILTCPDCGDVAELLRVPTGQEGVYVHQQRPLDPCRCGKEPGKCPQVARKHG